jgi:6-phosphogluconate dehydrogenase
MVTLRVQRDHQVVAFDLDSVAVGQAESNGAEGAASISDLVARLEAPRVVWIVVPHGKAVRKTVTELMKHLNAGDVIVDGGNSHYTASLEHARRCVTASAVTRCDGNETGAGPRWCRRSRDRN